MLYENSPESLPPLLYNACSLEFVIPLVETFEEIPSEFETEPTASHTRRHL